MLIRSYFEVKYGLTIIYLFLILSIFLYCLTLPIWIKILANFVKISFIVLLFCITEPSKFTLTIYPHNIINLNFISTGTCIIKAWCTWTLNPKIFSCALTAIRITASIQMEVLATMIMKTSYSNLVGLGQLISLLLS